MSTIIKQDIDKYITDALTIFGKEVNTNRQLPLDIDGLKPVFRRVIYTAMGYGQKMTKTATLSGAVLGSLHPHGQDSVNSVISSLVRWGLFEGQGSHGLKMIYGPDIDAAAPRYTEARIYKHWYDIFKPFMDYVPYKDGELEGFKEPVYLPTPLPLILMFSGLGIGYGVNCRIPMLTAHSLYEAMLKDDPSLLKAPSDLSIIPEQSDLDDLWKTGMGKITYKYNVRREDTAAGHGTVISGSAELYKPNLDAEFKDEMAKGQVFILDQTNGDIPQIFVGISPYVRAITYDEVQERCEKACTFSRYFRLTVTDGDKCYVIPLKNWLKETYDNYLKLVDIYKADQISKLEFDYKVYDWIKVVSECLINHRDYDAEQLSVETGCELDVVKAIMRKSISTLRNVDSTDKLKAIRAQINDMQSLDPIKYTDELIKKL